MTPQTFIYLVSMAGACMLSAGLAFYGLMRSESEEARTFSILMVDVLLWSLFTGFFELSGSIETARIWYKLRFLCITTVPVIILIFALQFTGRARSMTAFQIASLFIIPAFTQLFVHLMPDLFVSDVVIQSENGLITVVSDVNAAWFFVHFLYSIGCIVSAYIIVSLEAFHSKPVYRRQAVLVLISGIPPLFVSAVLATFFTRSNMQWVPLSLCLMGLICAWALFRHRLLDLVPVAQNALIQAMDDGLLVFDNKLRLVEMNPAAEKLLACSASEAIGRSFEAVSKQIYPFIVEIAHFPSGQTNLNLEDQGKHIEVRVIPLNDKRGRQTGRLVVLHDISEIFDAMRSQSMQLHEFQMLELELGKQTLVDVETGLYNRHYFDEACKKEIARAQFVHYSVSFAIVEIDHFQSLKDAFGLEGSRELFRSLAGHLQMCVRKMDSVCRLELNRILIMLPGEAPAEALPLVEDWQNSFHALKHTVNGVEMQLTISIGLAALPEDGDTVPSLIEAAIEALKTASDKGLNQIQIHNDHL